MPTIDYIQPFFNIKGEVITNSYRKEDVVYQDICDKDSCRMS